MNLFPPVLFLSLTLFFFLKEEQHAVYNSKQHRLSDSSEIEQMQLVEGGLFFLGTDDLATFDDEKPAHQVQLSSFLISRYEITFDEYDMYCLYTNRYRPSDEGWGRGNKPAVNVSWLDAIYYCNWRSEYEGLQACYHFEGDKVLCNWEANGYRLPTEAEWEYAAKGGQKSQKFLFAGSNNAKQVGWFWDNSQKSIHPVGSKKPNELGLYDMTGNVWEWCWDQYAPYQVDSNQTLKMHPTGPDEDNRDAMRILRGGSWLNRAYGLRLSFRRYDKPEHRFRDYGFRIVRKAE